MILYLAGAGLKEEGVIKKLPKNEPYNRLISYFYKPQVLQLIKLKENNSEGKQTSITNNIKPHIRRLIKK